MELMSMSGCSALDLGARLESLEVLSLLIIEFSARLEVLSSLPPRPRVLIAFSSTSPFFASAARYSSVSMNADIAIGFMMARLHAECGKSFILEDLDMIKMCGSGSIEFNQLSCAKYCSSSMHNTAGPFALCECRT